MVIDRHHLVLYAAVLLAGGVGAYGYHVRSVDVAEAKADAKAKQVVIDAAEKRMAERDAEVKQEIAALLAQKSTSATTPTQIVERIPQYFPQLQPVLQQPINPQTGKPDETKQPNLVFDAPQAKALNDTLVECKICQIQREQQKKDLGDKDEIIGQKDKQLKDLTVQLKGGSPWKRFGKAALVIGCAAAGAYAASPRGSKAAGIGAGAGAGICTIAWR